MLRSIVQGLPLRKLLSDLQKGNSTEQATLCIPYRSGKAMYVKPLVDSVVVVFPMHFEDDNDATMAVNFLQVRAAQHAFATPTPPSTHHCPSLFIFLF